MGSNTLSTTSDEGYALSLFVFHGSLLKALDEVQTVVRNRRKGVGTTIYDPILLYANNFGKSATKTTGIMKTYFKGTLPRSMVRYGRDIQDNIVGRMESAGIQRHSGRLQDSIKVSSPIHGQDFVAVGIASYPEMDEMTSIFTKTVAGMHPSFGGEQTPLKRENAVRLVNRAIPPEYYQPPRTYSNIGGYWYFLEHGYATGVMARNEPKPGKEWWDIVFRAKIAGETGGMAGKHFLHTATGKVHSEDVDVYRELRDKVKSFVASRMKHMSKRVSVKRGKTILKIYTDVPSLLNEGASWLR